MNRWNSNPSDIEAVNSAQHLVRECFDIAQDIASCNKLPVEEQPLVVVGLTIAIVHALVLIAKTK